MTKRFYTDLHSHITLYPYNMGPQNTDGMLYAKNPLIREEIAPNYTQSDLVKMAKGQVKLVFASLYPIEQGFMKIKGSEGDLADDVIKIMTSFPKERINQIQSEDHSYFDDLKSELALLESQNNQVLSSKGLSKPITYKIVRNFQELKNFLGLTDDLSIPQSSDYDNKIAVILTIEGAHSLFPKTTEGISEKILDDMSNPQTIELFNSIKEHIDWIKSEGVFSITFAHHFYNLLAGNSISFTKLIDSMLDQGNYSKLAFTQLGQAVIQEMMKTENGKRSLIIDVKHLSVPSRKWFYDQAFTKNVPVICSHTAVNGYPSMQQSMEHNSSHKAAQEKYKESTLYNPWDLNLSDEEIVIIAKRKGLIGLSLDQRILMGKERLDDTKKKTRFCIFPCKKRDKAWAYPFVDTVLYIASVLEKNQISHDEIWDNMTIGSDYDGIINPLNAYRTVTDYPTLQDIILEWFVDLSQTHYLLKGKSKNELSQIVEKLMFKNSLTFLQKNF